MSLKQWAIVGVLLSVSFLGACASPYTPNPDRPFEPIPEFTSSASLSIVNAQGDEEEHDIGHVLANYRKWTDVAIQIAERELVQRGMSMDPGAARTLRLAVTSASHRTGFVMIRTDIEMEAETGDGYKAKYTGANSSAMVANVPRQIDGAMMRVVVEMLKDPRIVSYLSQ